MEDIDPIELREGRKHFGRGYSIKNRRVIIKNMIYVPYINRKIFYECKISCYG